MLTIIINILIDLFILEKTKISYFAEKYERSTRSIQRYLDKIQDAGIPICSKRGRGGGIWLDNSVSLRKMCFTDSEIEDIIAAVYIHLPAKRANSIGFKMKTLKMHDRRRKM